LEKARFFYNCGTDSVTGRTVLVFIGSNYVQPSVSADKVMTYIAKMIDTVSFSQYTIVYIHCAATNNAESMSWIHSIAATFPRRCLTNLRVAVLYPTFWLKTHLRINRLGDLRPIQDISFYDNLAALFHVMGRDSLRLPDEIVRADGSVKPPPQAGASSSQAVGSLTDHTDDDDAL